MNRNDEFAGGANGHKYRVEWGGDHHPINGGTINAYAEDGTRVGRLRVTPRDTKPIDGAYYHGIHVDVHEDHQRQGVATQMWNLAKQSYPNLRHQSLRTDDAEGWAKKVGGLVPSQRALDNTKWRLGPGEPV
jgi:GNAT superfamily N-acetyltransferase